MLVEAITYRFRGHSMADPEEYRTKEQVEEWRERDPIATFGRAPGRRGRAQPTTTSRSSTRRRWPPSTRPSTFADGSPHPEPESLYDDIYVLGGQVRGWYSVDERSAGVHRGEDEREHRAGRRAPRAVRGGRRERRAATSAARAAGPSDSSQDEGKDEEAPDEAQDTERAEA